MWSVSPHGHVGVSDILLVYIEHNGDESPKDPILLFLAGVVVVVIKIPVLVFLLY